MATKKGRVKKKATTKKTAAKKKVQKVVLVKNLENKKKKIEEAKQLIFEAEFLAKLSSEADNERVVIYHHNPPFNNDCSQMWRRDYPNTLNDFPEMFKELARKYNAKAAAIMEEVNKDEG